MRDIQLPCCSPDEVVFAAADIAQSLYCHLLCGLLYADEVARRCAEAKLRDWRGVVVKRLGERECPFLGSRYVLYR